METNRSAWRARAAHAVPQRHEVVAVARQHGPHAGLRIHALRQGAGDGEHHVLLLRAVLADGAGILPAVTCIDGDDEGPRVGPRMLDLDRRFHGPGAVQVDEQPVAGVLSGLHQRTLGPDRTRQIEHDAQITGRPLAHAHLFDRSARGGNRLHAPAQARTHDVEHDPVRALEHSQRVLGAAGQLEHHPCVISGRLDPNLAHFHGGLPRIPE